jgi:hypothetical protein
MILTAIALFGFIACCAALGQLIPPFLLMLGQRILR